MSKRLFLAPHFSDAAFSCGGVIALDPTNSIVANVFSLKPKKENLAKYKDYMQEEYRKPEKKLQKMFKFISIHFEFPTAIDRGRKPTEQFSVELTSDEKELVFKIRDEIHALIDQYKITEVYCPMAIRNNIDHLIVKEAANKIAREIHVFYYKDFPNFLPEDTDKPIGNTEIIKIDISKVIDQKIAGISLYDKTIKEFFHSKEKIISLIRKNTFEIYWKVIS